MVQRRAEFLNKTEEAALYIECAEARSFNPVTDFDLYEAPAQFADILFDKPTIDIDARALADTLHIIRTAGRHVIAVPYSQGAQMMQQAMGDLREVYNYSEEQDSTCVGAVPLAAATDANWDIPEPRVKGIVLSNDLVPDLGGNDWPRSHNARTDSVDAEIAEYEARLQEMPDEAVASWQSFIALRHFVLSLWVHVYGYFSQAATRTEMATAAKAVYEDCAADTVQVSHPTVYVTPNAIWQLDADVFSKFETELMGRRIKWEVDNPFVAAVDTTGGVQGLNFGTTTVTARSGAARTILTVEVGPGCGPVCPPYDPERNPCSCVGIRR
jgi:hypothetical protein